MARIFATPAAFKASLEARLKTDLGFGDDPGDVPEILTGDDLMAFAEITPIQVLAIPKSQQFAEKIHAYTRQWHDRENMRTKDLVDLALLIETGGVTPAEVAVATRRTFSRRATHELPLRLPEPPRAWVDDFKALAAEARINADDLGKAFDLLSSFWTRVMASKQ